MTVFWIVAALFLLGALLLTVPPLLRAAAVSEVSGRAVNVAAHRDQLREAEHDLVNDLITPGSFAQSRAEIERRVLEDAVEIEAGAITARPARRSAIVLALLIPLGSVLTYLVLGNPDAAAPPTARAPASAATAREAESRHAVTVVQIEQRATALAERLKADPANAADWITLGRSYTALGRYRDAAIALRRANGLMPDNASLMAELADIAAMVQGRRLAGEPAQLVQRALDIDPRHVKALALAGSVAFEAQDYAAARGYWERLIAVLPAEAPMARSVRGSIAQAIALDGSRMPVIAAAPATGAVPTTLAAKLTGTVEIDAALAARVGPSDTLFVFARAAEGARMPLAIVRRPGATLPFEFALDDSTAMSPDLRLSGQARVVVGARISRTGNATPQAGDMIGVSDPVSPASSGVRVTIDRVQR
jgi:cytochrome c-type biogenesis protein CcmH